MSNISDLIGKIIISIRGAKKYSGEIFFTLKNGRKYRMYHPQNCCERVFLEDVVGDIADLINSKVITAKEKTSSNDEEELSTTSFTWTFYDIATGKGSVTIRWYGESNGYYSEKINFEEVRNER